MSEPAAASDVQVEVTDWTRRGAEMGAIRRTVFVLEQGVAEAEEWDGLDPGCAHVLARVNRDPVGTGRLGPTGKIGRLAVLAAYRRHGVGAALLRRLVELARERGLHEVYLHAQVAALDFYVRHGFVAEGPVFDEAGIAHRRMRLALRAADQHAAAAPRGAAHDPHDRG